jgi:hypothetical protein
MMIRFFSSGAFLLLAALIVSAAADDKPATPPPPKLAQALGTNVVGKHTFSPAWTGQCAVVHATGIFTQAEPPVMATNRYTVKFDTVVVAPKAQVGNVGLRGIARAEKDGGYIALHVQRDDLPGDTKLQSAKTLAELEKLLGQPQGFPSSAGEGGDRVSWSAFALNKTASLDTLQVNAVVEKRPRAKDAHVYSLEILRGKAAVEVKTPEKKDKKSDSDEKKSEEKKAEKKD